jgi:hypothetical protein
MFTNRKTLLLVALLAVVASLLTPCPSVAEAKKKGGKGGGQKPVKLSTSGLKANVQQAQAGLADAMQRGVAAQSRLAASQSRAMTVRGALEAARMDAEEATRQLRQIEADIVRSQEPDSRYADALKDFEEAEKHYHEVRAHVYETPEYLAKYREAASSPDRATRLPAIRKEAELKDPEYSRAAMQMAIKSQAYERLRMELFQANPDWVATSKAAVEARRRQAEAQEHFQSATVSKGITASNLSKASRDAAAAQQAIAKGSNAIKAVEAYNKKVDQAGKRSHSSSRHR